MILNIKTHTSKEFNQIPQIIHQVYEDMNGPSQALLQISQSWKRFHPNWEYRFWNRESIDVFLKSDFPDFLPIYQNYPYDIQRWDAIRYLILYRYGGLYADMDYECLAPLDLLLRDSGCCLGLEHCQHADRLQKPFIVGNALMAAVQFHSFFEQIIENLIKDKNKVFSDLRIQQILESTGPLLTTRIYCSHPDKAKIRLLPYELIAPLSMQEVRLLLIENHSTEIDEKIEKAYAIHYYMGSW